MKYRFRSSYLIEAAFRHLLANKKQFTAKTTDSGMLFELKEDNETISFWHESETQAIQAEKTFIDTRS